MTRATAAAVTVVFLCQSTIAQYPGARPVPRQWREGFQAIKIDEARQILGVLAGPDFRGRSPRTGDYAAAAGYAVALLRQWGMRPSGDTGSFFQRFETELVSAAPGSTALESSDSNLRLEFMKEFSLRAFEDFESTERFSFLRLPKGTDLSSIDLSSQAGRIVVVAPETATDNRDVYRDLLRLWTTAGRIRSALPVARSDLLRSTPVNRVKGIPRATDDKYSSFSVTADAARRLAQFCGAQGYLSTVGQGATLEPCAVEFKLKSKVAIADGIPSFNVVARIEGGDPVLRDEHVVVGAHLDHFGQTERGVRWGADDNASGVTAALLVAKAIQQNPVKPKRSIIIALWAMEESGLLGSWNYVNRPPVPLEKAIAYLNMDQVGRDEEDPRFNETAANNKTSVYIGTVKFNSEDLLQLLRGTNEYVQLRLKPDQEDRTLRSDTASFYRKGIPTLKAFTGEHPDYHRESDTPEKINYEKLVNIAKWIYLSSMELATRVARPRYRQVPFSLWTLEPAQDSPKVEQPGARSSNSRATLDREIAARFAPIFQQGLGSNVRADYITNFDFDGDWKGNNNWNNLDNPEFALRAWVYYSLVETATHYFVHYAIFHPRDYKGDLKTSEVIDGLIRAGLERLGKDPTGGLADEIALSHENDLEGCLVVASKGGNDLSKARVEYVETMSHNQYLRYRPYGAGVPREGGVEIRGQHPVLFVEPRGHGVTRYSGSPQDLQASVNGILSYVYAARAEDPKSEERRGKNEVGYDLVPLVETLWKRARGGVNETYGLTATYSLRESAKRGEEKVLLGSQFKGEVGSANRARAPWAWYDRADKERPLGEWFFDPAEVIARHFGLGKEFARSYVYHPFLIRRSER